MTKNEGRQQPPMTDDSRLDFYRKEIAAVALELGTLVTAAYREGLEVQFTLSENRAPGRSYPLPVLQIVVNQRPDA